MVTLNFVRRTETPGAHFAGNCEIFKLLLILRVSESFLGFHFGTVHFLNFIKEKKGAIKEEEEL